ncbi:TPA: molybdenum cofactor guanylyltransferase [Methanosarcina acetivorans]|uniref:Probable molybdenum cofactor guanylyltransferase n=2 Tax=Methanosarcina acetivorans TaxID=2214 RepID=MOBA_METAC|nr:molybdenum cofactor guanylyltransferase [Methanosarcina acetivorans]Q8TPD6.1 RecName: Full=Probable molybdenum cofactor guanylyltransferase; Short=MoCo guanylyltransferase; AltName: Full=GTP:molybdopterin guanylyltransferase; AltName: Full=Mo-MPT guanylyltransferase; AltName: Full=Molybdopterin guanylyltransferase; AltName: Full=Molybdopterin-guanine dinucleotide synthase; Short=MGD synthase [Methanosarcina acetivorans C2A]AAM05380.1 molybdopterin-guanine dinucleotide biosynthesis protein A [M
MSGKTELKPGRTKSRSAIVLAGGRGRRMGMVEKALLEFEGKTILERLLENLFRVVDEVILSVRDIPQKEKLLPVLEKFPDREIRFCFDSREDAGPLEGIRAGLLESRSEYSFVCAGDMPFVNSEIVDLLFEKANGHDAALPRWEEDRMYEPLHAVYSRKMLLEIEKTFEGERNSVLTPVFAMKDVVFVEVSEIRGIDPELRTFANINTVEDIESMIGSVVGKVEL